MQNRELRSLTALRGLAAMAVVLQHFSASASRLTPVSIVSLAPHGYMAVDFFFVLSGFIMGYTYLETFELRGMGAYLPFLAKRVARIFPLGVAVLALILLCAGIASLWGEAALFIHPAILKHGVIGAALLNLAHLQGFVPGSTLNGPSWSVSLECAAYLAFPLLTVVFCGQPRGMRLALAGVCVLALVMLSLLPDGLATRRPSVDGVRICAEFGLGLLCFDLYRERRLHSLGEDRFTWAVVAVALGSVALRCDLAIALCCPALVLAFACNRGRPGRLLGRAPLHWLGTVSFSLYLVHNMIRAPAVALAQWAHPGPMGGAAALLVALAGSLAVLPVAAASYALVERPGRRVVMALLERAGVGLLMAWRLARVRRLLAAERALAK